jgi:hypothetical protein
MKDYQKISDQELDHIFVDAFQSIESEIPEFNASFWNEMEAVLPQKQKRRIAAFWWYSAAALLFLVGGTFWYYMANIKEDKLLPIAQLKSENNQVVESTISNENQATNNSEHLTKKNASSIEQDIPSNQKKIQVKSINTFYPNPKSPISKRVSDPNSATSDLTELHELDQTLSVQVEGDEVPAIGVKYPEQLPLTLVPFAKDVRKEGNWYAQLSVGMGNSYQTAVSNRSTLVYGVGIGVGLHKRIGTMELQFGVQMRSEFIDNLKWKQSTFENDNTGNTYFRTELNQINQLYSIDFPMGIGGYLGDKNILMAQITPGIQLFGSGEQTIYMNDMLTEQRNQVSSVKHSKTMTMEIGLSYYRKLSNSFQVGGGVNTDIIRPFNSTYYDGNQTSFPVNFQLGIRKLF